ncbi:hypothetical protein [Methylobacterium sp. Leaf466]|uniref:hypothetical protein n=1 Tax=Methylobacterium sp. Leaf466 TaxID=1736386 RepID=UPI0006F6C3B4|nr:hypothetical protein [Methylobacterium sp. Leaf466]KQT77976.1 hypothetical protein ASG59_11775 [Methylobacterium sp. Leaf466]
MSPSPRTTITLPRARFEQLAAIADKRGLPNPTAVIEAWIARAIAEGEISPQTPGFSVVRDDDVVAIQIAGHHLPFVKIQKAAVIASVLSAAAGEPDEELGFYLEVGRPVVLDLGDGNGTLAIGRVGRGVKFILKTDAGSCTKMFSCPPGLAMDVVNQILTVTRVTVN